MRLNLSSEIVLNKVPLAYYKPKTTVEYSEIFHGGCSSCS